MVSAVVLPFDPSGIHLDRRQGLSRQLYQALRARVIEGKLSCGTRMPASRDLAKALGISRNSVVRAYDQLYAEGFIEGRVGDGTYIAYIVVQLASGSAPGGKLSTKPSTGLSTGLSPGLSTNCTEIPVHSYSLELQTESARRLQDHPVAVPLEGAPGAFRVGIPAFDLFPFDVWAKLHGAFWRKADPARLGYGDPAGDARLRELIAAYLRSSRGLQCTPEQILITCGAQQAISVCAQLLIEPGDRVAVENPGYRAAMHALANAGARLQGVAVDEEGFDTAQLEALDDCRLTYVTPAHQYPTGVTLSLSRRLALLDWAQRCDGWIIEDDYDGEYRYSGAPLAPLAALDRHGRVLYVGTFGKVAFPALRLGYLVLPSALVQTFVRRLGVEGRSLEIGNQAVMAEFIAAGHFQRHIRRMRRAALSRRDTLLAHWPGGIAGCGPMPEVSAGLHVKVPVDNPKRELELLEKAVGVGVEMTPLASYWLPGSTVDKSGLVLGFAAVPEPAICEALRKLDKAWR
jgi:GntR family transcriptional regulator/MocR family aminotransferase